MTEGAASLDLAAVCDLFAAAQVYRQLTEADRSFTAGKAGKVNYTETFAKRQAAFKAFLVCAVFINGFLAVTVGFSVVCYGKMGLFRLAKVIDQQTDAELNHDDGEDQLTAEIHIP